MWSPEQVYAVTGLSANRTMELFNKCEGIRNKLGNRFVCVNIKIFRREFYIARDPKGQSPFESWTTWDNKTVIFVSPSMSQEKLRHILAHELVVSLDAKTGMMYSSFLNYEGAGRVSGNLRIIDVGNLDRDEKYLQDLFNMAASRQVSFTFSALRGYMAERLYLSRGKDVPFELTHHENCRQSFLSIYRTFKNNPEVFEGDTGAQFHEMLQGAFDQRFELLGEEKVLKEILNGEFKFKSRGRKMTFCNYMATPLISPKSLYSFLSAGPRPKVTGGWSPAEDRKLQNLNGKQGQTIPQKMLLDQKLKQPVPGQVGQGGSGSNLFQKFEADKQRMNLEKLKEFRPSL